MTCENCNGLERCDCGRLYSTVVNDRCPKCADREET